MDQRPRGIDSLSPAQFAGVTIAISLFAFTCGGAVEAATRALAPPALVAPELAPIPGGAGPASPAGAPQPAEPQLIEDRGEPNGAPADAPPIRLIDGHVIAAPAAPADPGVELSDGSTAVQPAPPPDPSVAVVDAVRAPALDSSGWSSVPVIVGSAASSGWSVAVIDGSRDSLAAAAAFPAVQWRIVSGVDVIDGSAPSEAVRTNS